jgi:hypothetical protein
MARISGKDLAAIAALGVAGTMAYRDYNKKKEANADREAKDSVRGVAERPLPRQEPADEGIRAAYAGQSPVVEEKGPYRPRQEEISDKAPRVAPTRANANAAVDSAAKERARVDALMARAGPRGGNVSGRGQNYQDPRLAPNFRDPRVPLTISPEEQAIESAKFGNYPRRGASAAANPNMSDMGIGSGMKRGGKVSSKPKASSASSRGDGIAQRGKTRGKYL